MTALQKTVFATTFDDFVALDDLQESFLSINVQEKHSAPSKIDYKLPLILEREIALDSIKVASYFVMSADRDIGFLDGTTGFGAKISYANYKLELDWANHLLKINSLVDQSESLNLFIVNHIEQARSALSESLSVYLPPPVLSEGLDEGVTLEWDLQDYLLKVDLLLDETFEWFVSHKATGEYDGECGLKSIYEVAAKVKEKILGDEENAEDSSNCYYSTTSLKDFSNSTDSGFFSSSTITEVLSNTVSVRPKHSF